MKFTTTVKALKSAIETVAKCVPSKPLMPILSGIKLDCDGGELIVTAFNLAEGLQVICETESCEPGSIVVSEKDISTLLGRVSGDIEFSVTDLTISISTDSSSIEMQGMDASEYPELIFELDGDKSDIVNAELPQNSFRDAIAKCSMSVSDDDNKQIIQGINIKSENGIAKFASTDGHRLTMRSMPCEYDIESITIPGKFLTKLPKSVTETINFSTSDGQALFVDESGSSSICRLFDGKYPNYELLLPKKFDRNVTVNRMELIQLLAIAETTSSMTNLVRLKIKQNELSIESSRDAAKSASKMECNLNGLPLNIGFHVKYLIQGLKMFEDELVTINLNGATEPITIVSLDNLTTHLIMPIQTVN